MSLHKSHISEMGLSIGGPPVSADSVSAVSVIRGLPYKFQKIKEINGSQVSKRTQIENGP